MKIIVRSILLLCLIFTGIHFQGFSYNPNNKYLIKFKDRNNNPYSLSSPSAYLTARALQRRTDQHIFITTNDLPVNPDYIDSVTAKGAVVLYSTKWLNGVAVRIDDTTGTVLNKINQLPFVQTTNNI